MIATEIYPKMTEAIVAGDREAARGLAEDAVGSGLDLVEVIERGYVPGLQKVGELWEQGEYFLPELIASAEAMKEAMTVLEPALDRRAAGAISGGRVVIGTVEGDIHDIAKDIVAFMLDINGFEVIDLGVDVPPARFVAAAKETGAGVVGLSGFLTLAYDPMKATVEALAEAGLRDKVKIMIGGGQIDDQIRVFTGADAYGRDAMAAVSLARQWIGG